MKIPPLVRAVAVVTIVLGVMLSVAGTGLAHPAPSMPHPPAALAPTPHTPVGNDCITIYPSWQRVNTNVAKAFGQVVNTCGVDLIRAYLNVTATIDCLGQGSVNQGSMILPNPWSWQPPSNTQNYDLSFTGFCAVCRSNGVNSYPQFTLSFTVTARGTEPNASTATEAQPSPSWSVSMPNSQVYNPC